MTHWSEFVSAAVLHAECMRLAPPTIDIGSLMQAIQQAQQQAAQYRGVLGGGFDPRLITAR